MREVVTIKFEAFDGTMFEDRNKCEEYEYEFFRAARIVRHCYVFYKDGEEIEVNNQDAETLERDLVYAYQGCDMVRVVDYCDRSWVEFVEKKIGIELPKGLGRYKYAYGHNGVWWESVSE